MYSLFMGIKFGIGDLHFPFHSKSYVDQIYRALWAIRKEVTHVTQIGDGPDCYSASRWEKSFDRIGMTPKQEYQLARKNMVEFWENIHKIVPHAKKFQLKGNHCDRPEKKMLAAVPELEYFFEKCIIEFFTFKKVHTIHDSKQELEIDDVLWMHGYSSKLGFHADFTKRKVVCGHSHRLGLKHFKFRDEIIWELNLGHALNVNAIPARYRSQKIDNWIPGCGWVDDQIPVPHHFNG